MKTNLLAALALFLFLAAPSAAAQDNQARSAAQARQLVYLARQEREAGALAPALEKFKEAHAIMNVPTTGLEVAQTELRLGQLVEAYTLALSLARSPSRANEPVAFARARADLRDLAETLLPRLATLDLMVESKEAFSATLDGKPLEATPSLVNPRRHEVVVTFASTGKTERRSIDASEGAEVVVRIGAAPAAVAPLPIAPPAPPPTSPSKATRTNPLTYVGGAVVVAGVGVGLVTGGLAMAKRSDVGDRCAQACGREVDDEIANGQMLGNVSTTAFVVAGAGALVLAYGLLFPKESHPQRTVGASTSGARISF